MGQGNEGVAQYVQRIKGRGSAAWNTPTPRRTNSTTFALKNRDGQFVQPEGQDVPGIGGVCADWKSTPMGVILTDQPGQGAGR